LNARTRNHPQPVIGRADPTEKRRRFAILDEEFSMDVLDMTFILVLRVWKSAYESKLHRVSFALAIIFAFLDGDLWGFEASLLKHPAAGTKEIGFDCQETE